MAADQEPEAASMRAAFRSLDWSRTPLGPRADWPAALRTTVEIMLASRFAMCAAWGPELTFLYNDAYAEMLGARHPDALGRPMRTVWPELWDQLTPLIEAAMADRPVLERDRYFRMTRNGVPEDTWWSFSYSALRDDDGAVAGFLDVALDVTDKVRNELRLAAESEQLRASETRFRALVGARADAIYRMSPDWSELLSLDGAGFLADARRPAADWVATYIPAEDQAVVRAQFDAAVAARAPFELEHRFRHVDGSIGWIQSRAVPILDAAGAIVEWFGSAVDVTRDHESRAALASSREQLELATRAAQLGRFDYWPQRDLLEWDDRCRALFGLSPGTTVSYAGSFVAGLHPDDREQAVAAVAAALAPDSSRRFDTEYRTIGIEDGIERHVHAQGLAFFERGVAVRLIGMVRDVTADRRGDAALRQTEERLRLAVRATNDAIWDWDLVCDHVLWNEALTTGYGHRPVDLRTDGAWWLERVHPDDRARIHADIHAVIAGSGSDWGAEYRFQRGDGGYADVRDRGYVIRDAAGRAVRMIGAMLDQTERKEVERSLERTKEGLEVAVAERTRERDQMWRITPDLLCVAGIDGRVRETNPAWTEVLGWQASEMAGRSFLDFVHPDDQAATVAALAAMRAGESVFGFENRYRARDGQYRWFSWNAVPRDALIYAVVRDVTAAHAQAEALAKAEEQLRQSQKMEAVGQLTGGIAHDFNNMLTGVIGSLELLRRYVAEGRSDRVDRYIDAATSSAQRAAGLTQRLLAFSRRQSLDVQAVDVNRVVLGVEELLRRTLGEHIALTLGLDPAVWHATTDANQLESALLNLAINARDAMPAGGTLTIATAAATLDAAAGAGMAEFAPGDYVAVSVSDTGTGMAAEVIAKAFDPFFTTKPIGQGTGLGLSMIYGFARQTGGHARIASTLGEGSTVTLYLPRAREAARPSTEPRAIGVRARAGEQVMVVEDDPAVRMLVVDVLEGLGYGVLQAVDGQEAVALLERRPPIALLVSDVGLPGLNGRQVAARARAQMPELKVLFVTGYAEEALVRSGFLDPGMDMIAKPFDIDALAAKIASMLGHHPVDA
ncbi:PAS domain-containing protein [Sphingomonas sp. BK235]|uniref:PAS domain-containing hybrid sensor histidine kinase/response regulator n=1 Tax=Sphingomonas sp. BK235 TaxID=2512131 RepID=UPI00104CEE6A|nr:PAS domain-containing protein [Sphingomonas sp. BK235]TCP36939.1 PAS domain S-box-containing protein [Sphingomonas sp. BK235]